MTSRKNLFYFSLDRVQASVTELIFYVPRNQPADLSHHDSSDSFLIHSNIWIRAEIQIVTSPLESRISDYKGGRGGTDLGIIVITVKNLKFKR